MVCDCCGRKKKLFESFAVIMTDEGKINLCVGCNDLAYKIRDDANDGNKEYFIEHLKQLEERGKKARPIFMDWKKKFIEDNNKKLQ